MCLDYENLVDIFISDYYNLPNQPVAKKDLLKLGKRYLPFSQEESHILKVFETKEPIKIQQRFWEMYLYDFLKSTDQSVNTQKEGPDFIINNIYVEAVCPEPNEILSDLNRPTEKAKSVPNDEFNLKILSALKDKSEKFKLYKTKKIIEKNSTNIIAINTSNLGGAIWNEYGISQQPRLLEVCFGIGPITLTIDRKTGNTEKSELSYKPGTVKHNGTNINSEIFLNDDYRHISGIIFSNVNFCTKALGSSERINYVHNPLASNKLELDHFKFNNEYYLDNDEVVNIGSDTTYSH